MALSVISLGDRGSSHVLSQDSARHGHLEARWLRRSQGPCWGRLLGENSSPVAAILAFTRHAQLMVTRCRLVVLPSGPPHRLWHCQVRQRPDACV